ncbi:MAG: TRAP transporter large permease [Rhodospirillaceae bacterium]|nr:TRAP transporter large permease [Rhodospirillaceae bacterium]
MILAAGIILLLFVLLILGLPVAFSLALAGGIGLMALGGTGMMLGVLETTPLSTVESYELITVPMFILMAELLIISRISDEMFDVVASWVERLPGGLAIATALTGAAFGAISGSSTASAATLSTSSIPAMLRRGYEPRFASGAVAISGTLAMLIPPSIALILYGILSGASIAKLLIAGIVPGFLVAATIIATILILLWRNPALAPASAVRTANPHALAAAISFFVLFATVTGVIYLGVATPTEASALGALGALALAAARRRLSLTTLKEALYKTARSTSMIATIMLGAAIFGYFLTVTQTTPKIVASIESAELPRWIVLLAILLIYLILGCFLDQIAILILTVPIMLPLIAKLGYDPIWFGVLIVVTGEIGMVTPPLGLNVFVVSRYTGVPMGEVFAGVTPHVIAHLVLIAAFVLFPALILWLPATM